MKKYNAYFDDTFLGEYEAEDVLQAQTLAMDDPKNRMLLFSSHDGVRSHVSVWQSELCEHLEALHADVKAAEDFNRELAIARPLRYRCNYCNLDAEVRL
jgi:hypothetical protein